MTKQTDEAKTLLKTMKLEDAEQLHKEGKVHDFFDYQAALSSLVHEQYVLTIDNLQFLMCTKFPNYRPRRQ